MSVNDKSNGNDKFTIFVTEQYEKKIGSFPKLALLKFYWNQTEGQHETAGNTDGLKFIVLCENIG